MRHKQPCTGPSAAAFTWGASVGLATLWTAMLAAAQHPTMGQWTSSLTEAPAAIASRPNPYRGQADAVQAGAKLFRHHCAECHHATAEGGEQARSLRAAHVQAARPGALFWFLTNGDLKHGMPSWSRLPGERRWQLVSYLQSLGPVRP